MYFRFALYTLHFALCTALLSGCDQISRHKTLSTIFDGVPSLPPPEELCQDYAEKMIAAERAGKEKTQAEATVAAGSRHLPYEEKRCTDCHATEQEKTTGGLILPARELCFSCHTDLIKGPFVHGPAAVGDCLACHLPHSSSFESLLVRDKKELCAGCHKEARLAAEMHNRLSKKGMACTDCHNPHYGSAQYFLK